MSAADVTTLVVSLSGVGIAVYAAILSRRALAWQQKRDAERLATRLRVEIGHAAVPRPLYVAFAGDPDTRPEPLYYQLSVTVVNDGETTEYLASLTVENAAGTEGFVPSDQPEDCELRPRSRATAAFRASEVGFDVTEGLVGIANLESGAEIRSPVEHLDPEIVAHIEEFNRSARP